MMSRMPASSSATRMRVSDGIGITLLCRFSEGGGASDGAEQGVWLQRLGDDVIETVRQQALGQVGGGVGGEGQDRRRVIGPARRADAFERAGPVQLRHTQVHQ